MADNVTLPGPGTIVATDDVGGVEFQIVKLDKGGEGQSVHVSEANPLPVQDHATDEHLQTNMSEYGDESDQTTSLYDLIDPSNPDFIPLRTAPAGIEIQGQAPAASSFPVTLPFEQVIDKYLVGRQFGAGNLGFNIVGDGSSLIQPWIDCGPYRSIALQLNVVGSMTGVISFEGSNDGVNAVAVSLFDMAALSTAPISSITFTVAVQRFLMGPLNYKYFRARVSTVLAVGTIQAFTMLRMTPFSPPQQYAMPPVTANVAGMPAVGGNIADGTAPTAYPVLEAGQDNTGATGATVTTAALPSVPTIGAGLTRKILTDTQGNVGVTTPISPFANRLQTGNPVTVTGPRVGFMQGQYSPIAIQESSNQPPDEDISELLTQILLQLKVMNYYMKELPWMINQDSTKTRMTDEPQDLVACLTPEIGSMTS